MAKYRKKPVVVDAFRLTGVTDHTEYPEWMVQKIKDGDARVGKDYMVIYTLEGDMTAQVGDWIIKGVNGEIYPCKPDIFAKTYEEVFETKTIKPWTPEESS